MRRLLALLLVLVMGLSLSAQSALAAGGTVQVDGKILLMDRGLMLSGQDLLAPAGVLAKALGGSVTWNAAEGNGVLEAAGKRIELTDGQAAAMVNGYPVTMSAPVQVKEGEVYLPAAFLVLQFPGRIRIEHPAMKDARAMQLLTKAMETANPNRDIQSEIKVVVEEKDYFWVTFSVKADTQVRGKDTLTVLQMQGPLMLKESTSSAVKEGKKYSLVDGVWEEDPYGFGASDPVSELNRLMPMPMMIPDGDLAVQFLTALALEARAGEQRTVGNTPVQDIHLTLDFGPLIAPLMGGGRLPTGAPAPSEEMPEFIIEKASTVVTVDLISGRVVSQTLDLAIYVEVPTSETVTSGLRLELHASDMNTPNDTPIAWPEGIE